MTDQDHPKMITQDHHKPYICWICGYPTALETCKIDEHGLPVHEACHTLKLSLKNGPVRPDTGTAKLPNRSKAG